MWAGVAAAGIVLGAAYMLWLYQRTMFGKIDNPANASLSDLSLREVVVFAPLLVLAFWIGLYPAPFLRRLETSVGRVVARVNSVYAPVVAQGADCKTAAPVPPPPVAGMPPGIGLVAPCDEGVAKPEASKASRPNGEHR
jgi:NADH-quinone oxidoreductase subunit M